MSLSHGEVEFGCAVCGEIAGRVRLVRSAESFTDRLKPALEALAELDAAIRPEGQAALVVETFFGVASQAVLVDRIDSVAQAIAETDASALYRTGYAYAPFHCPQCSACYCGEHWDWRTFEDDQHSGVEGKCPQGHFHVLAY